jgi:hypothetical protein
VVAILKNMAVMQRRWVEDVRFVQQDEEENTEVNNLGQELVEKNGEEKDIQKEGLEKVADVRNK